MKSVLIVDDEIAIRETLEQILGYEGYAVRKAATGAEALAELERRAPDAMLLDIKMPGMDGFEVLERLQAAGHDLPVIVISGHGNIETAVEAVKAGAYDFLEKPLDRSRLLVTLAQLPGPPQGASRTASTCVAAGRPRLAAGGRLRRACARSGPSSPRWRRPRPRSWSPARTAPARSWWSAPSTGPARRRDRPLVEVNCAAIPKDLVESELFGHERGSFTGAERQRIGKFEQADGGTLFLDEIGDMNEEAQAKVLKAVEESRFQRVGGQRDPQVDVRIVAATNRDLSPPDSGFRQDLFFRLNVLAIHLPPLRERGGDIDLLLE